MRERLSGSKLGIVVAAVLFAGCGTSSLASSAPSVALRTCSEVGHGSLRVGYRRRALIFGPLALGDLRTYTANQPLPGTLDGRYGAYEIIAIVTAGGQPELSLPRSEWMTVGVIYDPNKFRSDGAYRIRDLDQVVRFRACPSPSFNHGVSQFDGGFVVSRAQCVHSPSPPIAEPTRESFRPPRPAHESRRDTQSR